MMESIHKNTLLIKAHAKELGFTECGIAKATPLDEEKQHLLDWIKRNENASLNYVKDSLEKRLNPKLILNDAKSVITLLCNYYPKNKLPEENNYKISKYAYGRDYHIVIKEKLALLQQYIVSLYETAQSIAYIDSGPTIDKAWAIRSGLGWVGKNTILINQNYGSFIFIAQLFINQELEYDCPVEDRCGSCTKCLDACPTKALIGSHMLEAEKCIAYQTITNKGDIPDTFKRKMNDWIYGCDICQNACPWNQQAKPHNEEAFRVKEKLLQMTKKDWQKLSIEEFNTLFEGTAIKRIGYEQLMRNISFLNE